MTKEQNELVDGLVDEVKAANAKLREAFVGKKFRVISDYNSQPIGSSKPSMKGRESVIRDAFIYGLHVGFVAEDFRMIASLGPDDIELI